MTDSPPQDGQGPSVLGQVVSDGSLLRRVRCGSEAAATRLYDRYAARLRALARARLTNDLNRRVDPDDIVQSVFRRFFQAARQGNYDAPASEDLWELLLVITLNRVRSEKSYHRAAKRDVRRTNDPDADHPGLETVAERDEVAGAMLRLHVEELLARLPADYRAVVGLRMQGFEVAEIAGKTGRSKRTVERILQETRGVLRNALNETD